MEHEDTIVRRGRGGMNYYNDTFYPPLIQLYDLLHQKPIFNYLGAYIAHSVINYRVFFFIFPCLYVTSKPKPY